MKEVVWIFGTSAAGKETFIKSVLENAKLREQFGWADKIVQASQHSIENIGQFENDPIVNGRELIIEEVELLLKGSDVVLIKWQSVDTTARRPQLLREKTVEAKQKIIELVAPEDKLIERLSRKVWWHDYGREKQFIEAELQEVHNAVTNLVNDFELIRASSASLNDYRLSFWTRR